MLSGRINSLMTSQDAPAYVYHHIRHAHAAGTGSVTTHVKLPTTKSHTNGFPTGYVVCVTPSQPAVASVSNQTPTGFDVTLTSLDGGALAEGSMMLCVIG
jgi:hypothetical protein